MPIYIPPPAPVSVTADSELPAAAALADATVNPTTTSVGALPSVFNGTTWDRQKDATAANGATSGVAAVNALLWTGSAYNRMGPAGGDATALSGAPAMAPYIFAGATWDRLRTAKVFKTRADASITASTPSNVWTPTSGKKFRLMCGQLSTAAAGQIILKDNTTEILRSPQLPAGGVWSIDFLGNGILSTVADQILKIDVTATGNVGGWVGGTEE